MCKISSLKYLSIVFGVILCAGLVGPTWAATSKIAPPLKETTPSSGRGSLFGVAAATLSASQIDRWTALRGRHQSQIGSSEWQSLLVKVRSRLQANLLQRVNAQVNSIRYVHDLSDRWLTPTEFVRGGGDCEDYAIAKFMLLKSLGVSASSMRIVALGARPGIAAHAVLVVDSPSGPVVLDNRRQQVYPLGRSLTSRAVYAFNDGIWWIPVSSVRTIAVSH